MAGITVTYNGDKQTASTCGNSPITLLTDGSDGSSKEGAAYTPVDMFVSSVGACMLTVMGMVAAKHAIDIKGTTASMAYTSDATTHQVASISITFHMPPLQLSDSDKRTLAATARACPVGASINPNIKKEITFEY